MTKTRSVYALEFQHRMLVPATAKWAPINAEISRMLLRAILGDRR